jgi:hypothetical protein
MLFPLAAGKSSRRGPDFFLIFRKLPFGQQAVGQRKSAASLALDGCRRDYFTLQSTLAVRRDFSRYTLFTVTGSISLGEVLL